MRRLLLFILLLLLMAPAKARDSDLQNADETDDEASVLAQRDTNSTGDFRRTKRFTFLTTLSDNSGGSSGGDGGGYSGSTPEWQVVLITLAAVFGFAGICAIFGIIYVNFFTWKAAYSGYKPFDMEENKRRNELDREYFDRTGGRHVRSIKDSTEWKGETGKRRYDDESD